MALLKHSELYELLRLGTGGRPRPLMDAAREMVAEPVVPAARPEAGR